MSCHASLASPSRRFFLRDATAEDHRRLDEAVGPLADRPSYDAYVQALYGFRAPVEAWIGERPAPSAWNDWRPTAIRHLLENDLSALGLARPPALDFAGPEAGPAGEGLLGILYTLEGASLGSQLIGRRAAGLGLGVANGAAHLAGTATAVGNWKGYFALLDSAPALDMERVADAARTAFRFARAAFEGKHA